MGYKILYATKHSLSGAAASSQIMSQIKGFELNQNTDFYAFIKDPKMLIRENIRSKNLYSAETNNIYLFFIRLFNFMLFNKEITMVYTRDLIVVLASILLRKKCVYEIHKPPSRNGMIFIKFFKNFMRFVAISENLKSYVTDELNVSKNSILVAHDAVDFELYESINFDKKTLRNKLDIASEKKVALYTGTVGPHRDMKNLLELIYKHENVDFFILGDDGTNFKNLLDVDSFPKNLKFRGYLDKIEVSMYQKSSDILLNLIEESHPNINFCSQLKIFEYFATGNITVTPDYGSLKEVINDRNSLVYSSNDPSNNLDNVFSKALNANNTEYLTKNAKTLAEKNTWKKRASKIIDFFNK